MRNAACQLPKTSKPIVKVDDKAKSLPTPQKPASPTPQKPAPSKTDTDQTPVAASMPPRQHASRWRILRGIVLVLLVLAMVAGGTNWYVRSLDFVSTDDAYVNGHVTHVAPRIAGQVAVVLVDDNSRVHKGELLVQLDKEPFEVQKRIAEAAVASAQADVAAAEAEARGFAGEARSMRFALEHAIEDVDNKVALLKSKIAIRKNVRDRRFLKAGGAGSHAWLSAWNQIDHQTGAEHCQEGVLRAK
jgi:multidrug resistance efflux pump